MSIADQYVQVNAGEIEQLPSIYKDIKTLFSKRELRGHIYLILILLSFIPIAANTLDVIYNDYDGNRFCGTRHSCGMGLASSIFVAMGIGLRYLWSKRTYKMYMSFLILGTMLLIITIVTVTVEGNENSICHKLFIQNNKKEQAKIPCSVRYMAVEILCVFSVIPAVIDFAEYWAENMHKKKYIEIRVIWFSIGLLISSLLTIITYGRNHDIYMGVFGKATYGICMCGYVLVVIVTLFSSLYPYVKIIGGNVLALLLLFGIILVQSRPNNDSNLDTLMCFIVAADIQILTL
eukprot:121760_1